MNAANIDFENLHHKFQTLLPFEIQKFVLSFIPLPNCRIRNFQVIKQNLNKVHDILHEHFKKTLKKCTITEFEIKFEDGKISTDSLLKYIKIEPHLIMKIKIKYISKISIDQNILETNLSICLKFVSGTRKKFVGKFQDPFWGHNIYILF